ncbi:hypothetical protein RPRSA1_gp36 [Ralstonia phage RSA1]|uniref:Uncharacterized protein n=1 Tax=Ralstonia phage RSA1 TaxID=2993856 RepID=A4PE58_9CAUD|nr:hypothetical protein RPRSA1_gp36 [Ralstonia phage RSA1]BAF52413.1 hypothetical protein [Ralstonia phage RSA1]
MLVNPLDSQAYHHDHRRRLAGTLSKWCSLSRAGESAARRTGRAEGARGGGRSNAIQHGSPVHCPSHGGRWRRPIPPCLVTSLHRRPCIPIRRRCATTASPSDLMTTSSPFLSRWPTLLVSNLRRSLVVFCSRKQRSCAPVTPL